MNSGIGRRRYVEQVIEMYRHTPGTAAYLRKADRRLAATLFDQGVPLESIEHALLLATARRSARDHNLPPLDPIASLHYILPILDELRTQPPHPGYFDYLRNALAKHQARGRDHRKP